MMISTRSTLTFAVVLTAAAYTAAADVPPRRVQVMAHGGARQQAPENTVAALERSIADAIEWIAVDVRLTKDKRHVLMHDADLARTTDGLGPVDGRTLAELKSLDAGSKFARRYTGERIPSLEEVLALTKGRVKLDLDCKQVDPMSFVRAVLDAGMESQVVVSGDSNVLQAIRSVAGGDRLALVARWKPVDGPSAFADLKPEAVAVRADDVTADVCSAFHARGIKVQAEALGKDDHPASWDRMIESGVDRLETDRPEELVAREILRMVAPTSRVKVAHHRGSSRYAPENTLPAYEKAIRLGADFVEFDIRTTRDGIPVLLHDGQLNRTTSARGPIRGHDSAEVTRLDAGAWFGRPFAGTPVPTLDQFFETVGRKVELYVDAKDIAPEALVDALRARNLIDRSVVYQSPGYLARLRAIEPRLRRMPPLSDASQIDPLVDRLEPYAFDTRWGILSKSLIERCHARGVKVFSDSIGLNESAASYRRAILDGIDLIQTDHPIRVLRTIELLDGSNRTARN
jgi:glycerophosphoryl diester phosphodiesterase